MIPLYFVLGVTVATILLGMLASGGAKGTRDFFVAGRRVGIAMNASAISGEYLSAASFMGIAGLVMKNGYDALWYPVGYAAGYLFLLLFIAGPLRRFGAYTIPDFAEGRFDSPAFRRVAVLFVLTIGFFYTMPQMKGAGLTMMAVLGWPYWAGIAAVGGVITFNVALGGMKGITLVQAFQYWAKLFAIALPLFVMASVFGPLQATPLGRGGEDPIPNLAEGTTIKVKAADSLLFAPNAISYFALPDGADLSKVTPGPGVDLDAKRDIIIVRKENGGRKGILRQKDYPDGYVFEPGTSLAVQPGFRFDFRNPARAIFEASPAPNAPTDVRWAEPYGPLASKNGQPLLWTYSLIVALVCGTAGLPHILVRFYTNPDGRAAKRTTLMVMALLGLFYIFTPLWGTLGRAKLPELYSSGATDAVVLRLPGLIEGLPGQLLVGIAAAGAFAAFMSTFSGLLVSMAGAFAHDVYGTILRPAADERARLLAFRLAAVGVGIVSMALGLLVESFDIATMVGWAFAIGAASYFPLLLLGSWWRGLTAAGAGTGMILGGGLSLIAIIGAMLLDKKVLALAPPPIVRALMEQPAIWGVPLAIGTMILVSRRTAGTIPADVDAKMLRLHAPEALGVGRDYVP